MTPRATYRVQLGPAFGFDALRSVVPYLHTLGISHLYLSPVFRARTGSEHGYDVTNHGELNPELGGEGAFMALAEECRKRDIGLVLDIVPNHMAVMTGENPWWMDVLRHGRASRFASYFDIDWTPARAAMRNRLLVPVLADPQGEVIDQRRLALAFDPATGEFSVHYAGLAFPLDPDTCTPLRDAMAARGVPEDRADHIQAALDDINRIGNEANAQLLTTLLAAQPYRLAFWRVSGEEINYRRFFDVNDLAALRVEDMQVFEDTHALVARLWRAGAIDGLRVDHADGLYDPAQYFHRLRRLLAQSAPASRAWIVAEKILGPGEQLPADWKVEGTTGYEFASLAAAWLMKPEGADMLERTWQRFAGHAPSYGEVALECRRLAMRSSLAAEISGLAARLDRLAQMHRNTLDFTLFDLRQAIVEVIATFPVYRTYVTNGRPDARDAQYIRRAVGAARAQKIAAPRALDFLESVLLGTLADDPGRASAACEFVLKFQQVTAPVMAKGIEDTAFYRHPCLLAMNEVGGDPLCRGITTEALHRANEARARDTPHGLLATSTHDTKRGEDPRARLCVLSEVAHDWAACAARWRRLKSRRRNAAPVGGVQEYLLLQSLLGIWPLQNEAGMQDELRSRMEDYAIKSAREAKLSTSWLEPDAEYERVLRAYVGVLLPGNDARGFRRYFEPVLDRVLYFGLFNSLATLVLKLTVPGVPDIYQGNELPALVLVDPDNRRTPDFAAHAAALEQMRTALAKQAPADLLRDCMVDWRRGHLKLFVTWRLLELRRLHPALFDQGEYLPLQVEGEKAAHLCAFARRIPGRMLIVVISRWGATLTSGELRVPVGEATWRDTRVLLPKDMPADECVDAISQCRVRIERGPHTSTNTDQDRWLPVAALLDPLPFCALVVDEGSMPLEKQQ